MKSLSGLVFWDEVPCWGFPPPRAYMREIGAMWQLGVLTGKPCTFLVKMGHFQRFGTIKMRRDF